VPESVHMLYLYTDISCRCQMAEGWTRHTGGGRLEVQLVGIETHSKNLPAVAAMAEVGIDISDQESTTTSDTMLEGAGQKIDKVERTEINEASGTIVLAVYLKPGFAEEIVNRHGDAISQGHPIRATGPIPASRLIHSMNSDGRIRGLVIHGLDGRKGVARALQQLR